MESTHEIIEHLFRQESGKITATLLRLYGRDHFDLVEDSVQEALVRAIQRWPFEGVPENPAGWLFQVARNCAVDELRKAQKLTEELTDEIAADSVLESFEAGDIRDDVLKLLFVCCHPILSSEAQVALTLKTVCGFATSEIANAFFSKEETIAQRIVRAKKTIAENEIPFELPDLEKRHERVESVLRVLYLWFNEGYSATSGSSLIRKSLCDESIRVLEILVSHPTGNLPAAHALLALFYFQSSRFEARLDIAGDVLLLEDQDRKLWDQGKIAKGLRHLSQSACGDELSDYHLQAGIASVHTVAESFEETDWRQILEYYDELLTRNHSPVVALNRTVAICMVDGPDAAILEIEKIRELPPLRHYYLMSATLADFFRRKGDKKSAYENYENALLEVRTEPERRFLKKRIYALKLH